MKDNNRLIELFPHAINLDLKLMKPSVHSYYEEKENVHPKWRMKVNLSDCIFLYHLTSTTTTTTGGVVANATTIIVVFATILASLKQAKTHVKLLQHVPSSRHDTHSYI